MTFSKSFAYQAKDTPYSKWVEITISDEEEQQAEQKAKRENKALMQECLQDAKELSTQTDLKDYQSDMVALAVALFEKRASHTVFYKEAACKKRFDELYPKN